MRVCGTSCGSPSSCNPLVDQLLEERERHAPIFQYHSVEIPETELRSERGLRPLTQLENLELADLVGAGLARHGHVTLDLGGHLGLSHAGGRDHVGDGLLA